MADYNDTLADLEADILGAYLRNGFELGVGKWGFRVVISSEYKFKKLLIVDISENYERLLFSCSEPTTQKMFSEAFEWVLK